MKHFPKILFKRAMTLALMVGLITTVLFSTQKANSAGPTASQTQGYFYCLADPACTVNFNCPYERTCTCASQSSAATNYARICGSQPTGIVSGTCENCGGESNPGHIDGCVSYGKGGEHEGWCGCKITCATPTPTPIPPPKDCGQRDANLCSGGSCDYTSDPTDFCQQTVDYSGRSICACVTPTPSGSSNAGTANEGNGILPGGAFIPAPVGTP